MQVEFSSKSAAYRIKICDFVLTVNFNGSISSEAMYVVCDKCID